MPTNPAATNHPTVLTGRRDPRLAAERSVIVRSVSAQVQAGAYNPPMEGVVESLVLALLPHIRVRG